MRHSIKLLLPWAASLMLVVIGRGQEAEITVDGTASFNSAGSQVIGNFNAISSDKLVVIVTGEHGFPNNPGGDCTGVTYDGVPLTQLIDRDPIDGSDITHNDIWYLDAPATSDGEIIATVTSRASVTVIGLSGTADGAGNMVIGPQNSNSANLSTSAGSIVIASYGMGGNGNSADYGSVDPNAPLVKTSALGNGNYDGQVTGYALDVAAGSANYSFNDDSTTGAHVIAAEFLLGPPPPLLTLEVNVTSGEMQVRGHPDAPNTIRYYEIKSVGNSLDSSGWNSLTDQDYDGLGAPDGSGNGWEEAGGAGSGALAEGYLLGESTIPPEGLVELGAAYRTDVDARDLSFQYLTDQGKVYDGIIAYLTPADLYAQAAALAGLEGADADPEAVPHSDGVPNLLKYAFNMDLSGPDASNLTPETGNSGLPIHLLEEDGGQMVFRLEYLRHRDSGLIYTPQESIDLIGFAPMAGNEEVVQIDENWERVTLTQPVDISILPSLFGLVEVTLPE